MNEWVGPQVFPPSRGGTKPWKVVSQEEADLLRGMGVQALGGGLHEVEQQWWWGDDVDVFERPWYDRSNPIKSSFLYFVEVSL